MAGNLTRHEPQNRETMEESYEELRARLAATIATYRDALMAYRLADRELCNLESSTRDAFARLHAAEDTVDDLLGLTRITRKEER